MQSTVIYHLGWAISCSARALKTKNGKPQFEAMAALEKFSEPSADTTVATREANVRRAYGVSGHFDSEELAKDAVVSAAKRAIDLLYA